MIDYEQILISAMNEEMEKVAKISAILGKIFTNRRAAAEAARLAELARSPSMLQATGQMAKKLLPIAGLATAAYAIPYGITTAVEAAKASRRANAIEQSYEQMFDESPELKEYRHEGRENEVRRRFDILKNFAPDVAASPMVAGSFVKGTMESPDLVHPASLKPIIDMQGAIAQSSRPTDTYTTGYTKLIAPMAALAAGRM